MYRIAKIALISVAVLALLMLSLPGAAADDYVGGVPLTTVQSGTVTGDLWFDVAPAPDWGATNVVKTFTLPETAIGNITWARLYVSAYCGHMQNDYAFTMTTNFDGDGASGYETTWPETAHGSFVYIIDGGNDNSEFAGHSAGEPYLMLNEHETRVTSDYLATYDVTGMITDETVNVNVNTVGSYDGRIKVISLIVAYDDPASTTNTYYWVNQGHDVCSYYSEDYLGYPAIGTTTFSTSSLSGIDVDSAILTIDYMASNNGYYGFPTADNNFVYTGGSPPVEGSYTNELDRTADVQGSYSGVDSWDVTDDVDGTGNVVFAYARYFPGTGTAAFYKIPIVILEVKEATPTVVAPVAAFSADDTTPDVGQTVVFADESTNTPTGWAWAIEGTEGTDYQYVDSTSATSQNPHVQFLVAGAYDVTLAASNAAGSDAETRTDYITATMPAPVAAFSATPATGNSPLAVSFDASASTGAITSYAWDFNNDGTTDLTTTSATASYTYTNAGYYTVKLAVTGPGGSDDEVKTNLITAKCNLLIQGVLNSQASTVFANEQNTLTITLVKNTVGNSPATEILVTASDGWSGRAPVAAMGPTGSQTVSIVDPTVRTTQGSVTYTYKIDPDNLIPETDESTNQQKTIIKQVKFNGYKGVQYWNSTKASPSTYLAYDIHGSVIHSFGDSHYVSGKGSNWQTLTWNWNAGNLTVPAGATVLDVRLYIPYCWDFEHEIWNGLTTTTFNGATITPLHMENDTSNFGAYADYEYGLVTYNVTGLYVTNGDNVATFTRTYWNNGMNQSPLNTGQPGSLSPAGFTLLVVYEDQSETRKQIFINEGWDLLGASQGDYGTTESEATSYQDFTGMTIDMANAVKANLTTFVPWGSPQSTNDTGEGNLYVNGQQIGHNVWTYGERTVGESDDPQVAVDIRDVLSYLYANGTGNGIAIQSTAGASPCMVAERSLLVVEFPMNAPVAAFSADDTTPDVGQTVVFSDESTNTPTSWTWTIEGMAGTDYQYVDSTSATSQNPHVQFLLAGTYDVTLVATNAGGSDTKTRTGYIAVKTQAPVVDFAYTPASGTAPLTIAFDATNTGGQVTSWKWEYSTDGTTWNQFATTEDPSYTFNDGTYSIRVTATGPDYSDTETKSSIISVGAATITVTMTSPSIDFGPMSAGNTYAGSNGVSVDVAGGTAWSVTASASNGGYMGTGVVGLASPFQLSNDGTSFHAMTTDFPNFLTGAAGVDGSGSASVRQAIAQGDAVGAYGITITLTGGFI